MLIDKNKLSKNNFIKKFGHLRPDTYEITSKNYEDGYELYFKNNKKINKKIDKKKFIFNKLQIKKINKFLFKNDLNINFSDFIFFIKESIKNREYAKYIFTKSIDLVFRELKKIARRTKININEISYIDIKYILNLYYNLNNQNISDKIKQISNENKKIYKFNLKIMLPEILSSYQDIYSYSENINKVNFVGNKTVILNTVFYKKEIKTKLKNKIVCIESADPGYDFIFNENIGGLITKFGGANSHMAIRCAELGLPAAIGVGSLLFKNITDAKIISLNPSSNKIDIIK
jgi:phosphoenolpyruvate-protein kinase (PTS system EI component)